MYTEKERSITIVPKKKEVNKPKKKWLKLFKKKEKKDKKRER